jgi:hypothetical protein
MRYPLCPQRGYLVLEKSKEPEKSISNVSQYVYIFGTYFSSLTSKPFFKDRYPFKRMSFFTRWAYSEKIIGSTSSRFRFLDCDPLDKIGCHMFPQFYVRTRSSIIVNAYRMMVDKNPSCDYLSFKKCEKKSTNIPVPDSTKK